MTDQPYIHAAVTVAWQQAHPVAAIAMMAIGYAVPMSSNQEFSPGRLRFHIGDAVARNPSRQKRGENSIATETNGTTFVAVFMQHSVVPPTLQHGAVRI